MCRLLAAGYRSTRAASRNLCTRQARAQRNIWRNRTDWKRNADAAEGWQRRADCFAIAAKGWQRRKRTEGGKASITTQHWHDLPTNCEALADSMLPKAGMQSLALKSMLPKAGMQGFALELKAQVANTLPRAGVGASIAQLRIDHSRVAWCCHG